MFGGGHVVEVAVTPGHHHAGLGHDANAERADHVDGLRGGRRRMLDPIALESTAPLSVDRR